MRYKKVIMGIFFLLGVLLFCTGCQNTPSENAVISKNDGAFAFDATVDEKKTHPLENTANVTFKSTFTSTDESVNFKLDINQIIHTPNMPIIQVSPHYLSGADAERVAKAIFPSATFYEAEPEQTPNYSKDEIQAKLSRWAQYTNTSAMKKLYGDQYLDSDIEIIKSFIEDYTSMYECSTDENPHVPCSWEMRKASEYMFPENGFTKKDTNDDNDMVSAQFNVDGIPYCFTATTRNRSDYKVNMISCYIYDGMCPLDLDERHFVAQLCRTSEPTQDQISAIKEKAEQLLSSFNLGQWTVDECYVASEIQGAQTEYVVRVNAVPVLNGVDALRRPQITSLQNKAGYASSQYLTDAQFAFSANGTLISLSLFTPLDIQNVVNNNAKVMTIESLLSRAEELLALTDSYNYGMGPYLKYVKEEIECNVTATTFKYGLSRIRVPDIDDCYHYIPSLLLEGNVEYIGKETGKSFYASDSPQVLVVINAVDGTVINATNE